MSSRAAAPKGLYGPNIETSLYLALLGFAVVMLSVAEPVRKRKVLGAPGRLLDRHFGVQTGLIVLFVGPVLALSALVLAARQSSYTWPGLAGYGLIWLGIVGAIGTVLWRRPSDVDGPIFVAIAVLVLMAATGWFAAVGFTLQEQGHLGISTAPGDHPLGRFVELFVWQPVQMLPLLDAPRTLRWSEPLRYESSLLGALTLAYRCVIVVPVIAAIRFVVSNRRQDAPAAPRIRDRSGSS